MLSLLRPSLSLGVAGLSVTRCFRCFSHSSATSRDISKITISGTLFRPPELSTTSSGRQCIRYTVRSWRGGEKSNYFEFLCMTDNSKSIEYLTGLTRGSKVLVEGDFSPYQVSKEDGSKVKRYSIFANTLYVIERGKPDEEVAGEAAPSQAAPTSTKDEAAPDQAVPAPTEDEAAPAQAAPTPTEDEAAPDQAVPAPTEDEAAPDQAAPTPTEDEASLDQAVPTPIEGDETPRGQT